MTVKLTQWSARRSGATLTVTGLDVKDGRIIKYAGVTCIRAKQVEPDRSAIVAERGFDVDVELMPTL